MTARTEVVGQLPTDAMSSRCVVADHDPEPLATGACLTHLRLARRELAATARFLEDFGLVPSGGIAGASDFAASGNPGAAVILEPQQRNRFLGFGIGLQGSSDLDALDESALATERSADGKRVLLTDPDGWAIEAEVPGPANEHPNAAKLPVNAPNSTLRVNEVVRGETGPAPVFRLGHIVLGVRDIEKSIRFYQRYFGMRVSDFIFLDAKDSRPFQAFMRFDRGSVPCDHHSLALVEAPILGLLHSAFEVSDFNAVASGGDYLRKRKHQHVWGIGRHTLGSNIFDYWRDPGGDLFEHFCDVDQFDDTFHAGYHLLHHDSHHQWGPALTGDFLRARPLPAFLREIAGRLLFEKGFNLDTLRKVGRASARKLR